jgi:hypothetical protein
MVVFLHTVDTGSFDSVRRHILAGWWMLSPPVPANKSENGDCQGCKGSYNDAYQRACGKTVLAMAIVAIAAIAARGCSVTSWICSAAARVAATHGRRGCIGRLPLRI